MGTAGRMLLVAAMALLFYGQSMARADMYTYVDSKGTRYYTNVPASNQCRLYQSDEKAISKPSGRDWPEVRVGGRRDFQKNSTVYDQHIKQCGYRYNVDPQLIKAIIKAESDFDCYARSQKGAQGLMQLMPDTARDLAVRNPFHPTQNMDGGIRYLRKLLDQFQGNLHLALAAYNAGENAVIKYNNTIPPFEETRTYVKRVLKFFGDFQAAR